MEEPDFQDLHLMDYVGILKRRWLIILACLLAGLFFFWRPILSLHPPYKSTGSLQLEEEKGMGPHFGQGYFPEFFWHEKWMNNQINILKSKQVAEQVVGKLALRLQVQPEERISQVFVRHILQHIKENPIYQMLPESWTFFFREIDEKFAMPQFFLRPLEVKPGVVEGQYRVEFQDPQHFMVYGPKSKKIGAGEVEKTFAGPHFSFVVEGIGKTKETLSFQIMSERNAIGSVQSSIMLTPENSSTMIHVGAKWNEPTMSGEVANAIMESYLEILVSKKAKDVSKVLDYVEIQLKTSDEDLHKAEENLKKFKGEEKIFGLDAQVQNTLSQYTTYEKELASLGSYRQQAAIVLSALKNSQPFTEREALFSLGIGLSDPLITAWCSKLSDLLVKKETFLTIYREEHPKVQQIAEEIEIVKRSIITSVENLISTIKIKEKAIQAALSALERKVQHIPTVEQEISSLQRLVKVSQSVNDFLLQKKAELSVNKASVLPNVFIVERAVAPGIYVGPNVEQKLLWALLIGVALGIGLAFLVEYFDTSIKTPEQVQKITGLPFLGSIYHFSSARKKPQEKLQMLEAPYSHLAEAFRTIKTNILFTASVGDMKKFLLITSSAPNEGKTFVSANLAVTFAQSGKRTLLVETDLRNPNLHQIFGWEKSPGLTNALLEEEIVFSRLPIRQTQVANLEFLTAGDKPPNPSELLCSDRMEKILAVIREQYDFVLFDSPPVFLTSDPIILAQRMDGVILVARSEETKREILRETVARLLRVDAKILGVLFNDLSVEGRKYYYKKYSYYYTDGGTKKKRKRK